MSKKTDQLEQSFRRGLLSGFESTPSASLIGRQPMGKPNQLAKMLASGGRDKIIQHLRQSGQLPTIADIIRRGSQPEPPPMQGPPVPSQWQPTQNEPFAGMEAFTWKNPDQSNVGVGTVMDMTPPRDFLQTLQRLGRRRLPSKISGVGGGMKDR